MELLHGLHNHHRLECSEILDVHKVIVDKCFAHLFSKIELYKDGLHVIVSRYEYVDLKVKEKEFINRQRAIEYDIQKVINEKFYDMI